VRCGEPWNRPASRWRRGFDGSAGAGRSLAARRWQARVSAVRRAARGSVRPRRLGVGQRSARQPAGGGRARAVALRRSLSGGGGVAGRRRRSAVRRHRGRSPGAVGPTDPSPARERAGDRHGPGGRPHSPVRGGRVRGRSDARFGLREGSWKRRHPADRPGPRRAGARRAAALGRAAGGRRRSGAGRKPPATGLSERLVRGLAAVESLGGPLWSVVHRWSFGSCPANRATSASCRPPRAASWW
jgi:hypothetical protein